MNDNFLFGMTIMVQFCGLISLMATRFSKPELQAVWNALFFATLLLIGAITIFSIQQESGYWLVSSSTLAIMIVGATFGSNHSVEPAGI